MSISVLLCDLDNTLYSASSGLLLHIGTRITQYLQELLHIELDEALELRRQYFASHGTTLRGLQQHYTVDTEQYLLYIHDVALEQFLTFDAEVDRLLSTITASKAIFTNSPAEHAQRALHALQLEHHFEQVFDLRYFGSQPKPDLVNYQIVLEAMNVTGEQTVFIEDTQHNLAPAKTLGMTTILIDETGSYEQPATYVDYTVTSITAALQIVLNL
ncbi:MAG: FMN phosphatase YigB, HAD superfamily [Chloroflexi bacterium AL-W]|nr:FMN phosphatase YigB, HAD superfamily [Chloroflexi bacterium AL-N1]NOK69350.1 FMN phosphatase YigB, HAD superfamily [Chloroflexi bacterium AL-N10]NOK76411.1 FMN phosphatase YigB, HAD superfamily [Chloroflexi bacterium AL-N5]NOK83528.1 FMN phosphatase YigB, HAD superfamily [Chloroflexi bacterium AL-W]NOK91188.1 FMN phosphatase YigB, HAD superfamily [Chloroflexi bacterium AL-N15]